MSTPLTNEFLFAHCIPGPTGRGGWTFRLPLAYRRQWKLSIIQIEGFAIDADCQPWGDAQLRIGRVRHGRRLVNFSIRDDRHPILHVELGVVETVEDLTRIYEGITGLKWPAEHQPTAPTQ